MTNVASAYKHLAKWEEPWVQMRVPKLSIVSEKTVSTNGKAAMQYLCTTPVAFQFKTHQSSQSTWHISQPTTDANLLQD